MPNLWLKCLASFALLSMAHKSSTVSSNCVQHITYINGTQNNFYKEQHDEETEKIEYLEADVPKYKCMVKDFHLSKERVTWTEAFFNCFQKNMRLCSITSLAENEKLKEELRNLDFRENNTWVSGYGTSVNYNVIWMSTGLRLTYNNWAAKQSYSRMREFCVTINRNALWYRENCWSRYYYVCEIIRPCDEVINLSNYI